MNYPRDMDGAEKKKSRSNPASPLAVQFRAEFQFPAGQLVQLPCAQFGDLLFPVEYRDLGQLQRPGDGYLGPPEVLYDVSFVHPIRLHMLNSYVKDADLRPRYAVPAMETMGDRIRTLRQARGWTQEQLGERIGVSKVSVSQWETGATSNIKLKTFIALYEELQTTPHYLIFGPDLRPARRRNSPP